MDFSVYFTQLKYLIPEITLLVFALAAMVFHLFGGARGRRWAGVISLAGLLVSLWVLIFAPLNPSPIYSGTLNADAFAFFFKIIFLLAGALSVVLAFKFFDTEGYEPGEVYYLLLFAVCGMMLTVSATDLISFYASFELFALVSYILAAIFKKERRSAEAGLKYFILGVLSTGIMLLGMALVYGLSGQTNFYAIGQALAGAQAKLVLTGMIFFFIGLFFKLALVPFHMWTPDVYEGAPTPLVAFLSTAPKAAVFAVLMRLIMSVFSGQEAAWSVLFSFIAVVTMFWGNIAALMQTNIKRMMAYSSIAHAGYILIGLAAWSHSGSIAVLFYLFVYLFMNTAAFAIVLLLARPHGFAENVDDLNGLAQHSPLLAGGIVVLLLSLTGIPPTAGFFGKYYLFTAAIEKGLYWLVVAGALNSVISLFYYFRIGKAIFMENPTGPEPGRSLYVRTVLYASFVAILLFGILPGLLIDFVAKVSLR